MPSSARAWNTLKDNDLKGKDGSNLGGDVALIWLVSLLGLGHRDTFTSPNIRLFEQVQNRLRSGISVFKIVCVSWH